MSRRARNHEYFEEDIYEEESDTYRRPRRSKRERFANDEEMDYGRRMPPPLPVEELEHLHIREPPRPDFIREGFDHPGNPGPSAVMREREAADMPPRETLRGYERDRNEIRERRARPRLRKVPREEDVYFQEDVDRRRFAGSESDEAEASFKNKERAIPPREHGSEEELIQLHRGKREKKGRRMKHSKLDFERDEFYREESDTRQEYAEHSSDDREAKVTSRLHPRFHHHADIDEEDINVRKDEQRRGRNGRFREKEEIFMQEREFSTSPESPSSRELSQIRKSHATSRGPPSDVFEQPRAPRALSLNTSSSSSFDELEIRHRTRAHPGEKIIIERHNGISPPPARLSSESEDQHKETTRAKLKTASRRDDVVIMEREPQHRNTDEEIQVFEEAHYTRRDFKEPPPKNASKVAIEGKAIALVDSENNIDADQEVRRRQEATQRSRSTTGSERLSDEDINRRRGQIGRRYIGMKDKRDRLWTEITKDLLVREALERSGYEYEETESFYYIFSYLEYDDISALVALSEEIRRARRRRIQEIQRERASMHLSQFVPESGTASAAPILPGRLPPSRARPRDDRRLKKERGPIIEEGHWRPARSDRY